MSDREVERGSGVAVWRQIGEALADDIRKQLYLPGEQLPPEPELATPFAVNPQPLRPPRGGPGPPGIRTFSAPPGGTGGVFGWVSSRATGALGMAAVMRDHLRV